MKLKALVLACASVVLGACSSGSLTAGAPSNDDIRKAILQRYNDVPKDLTCTVDETETPIANKARLAKFNKSGDYWIMDCTGTNAVGMQHEEQWQVAREAGGLVALPYTSTAKAQVHEAAPQAEAAASPSNLTQPNYATPDSDYQPLPIGDGLPLQLAFQYLAHATGAVDYMQLARLKNNDYDNQPDQFKRQDMIAALTPELDRGIASAKAHPYIRWHYPVTVGAYDAADKGFALISGYVPPNGVQIGRVGFADGSMLRGIGPIFPVTDEALARQIEGKRAAAPATSPVFGLNVFAFVQGDNERHKDGGNFGSEVTLVVTKLQLTDGDGGPVIAEVKASP